MVQPSSTPLSTSPWTQRLQQPASRGVPTRVASADGAPKWLEVEIFLAMAENIPANEIDQYSRTWYFLPRNGKLTQKAKSRARADTELRKKAGIKRGLPGEGHWIGTQLYSLPRSLRPRHLTKEPHKTPQQVSQGPHHCVSRRKALESPVFWPSLYRMRMS